MLDIASAVDNGGETILGFVTILMYPSNTGQKNVISSGPSLSCVSSSIARGWCGLLVLDA
jgi:hypothetical protein